MWSRRYPTRQMSLVQKQTQQVLPECLSCVCSAELQVLRGPRGTPEGQRRVHDGGYASTEAGLCAGTWEGNERVHWGRPAANSDSVSAERGLQGVRVQAGYAARDSEVHLGREVERTNLAEDSGGR